LSKGGNLKLRTILKNFVKSIQSQLCTIMVIHFSN
jgi:hypothetical protein